MIDLHRDDRIQVARSLAAPRPSVGGTDAGSISQVAAVAITVTQPADRRARVGLQRSQISPHSRYSTGRKDARVVS